MQAKLRSKTHRCLVGFIIVMLSTPHLFIVNLPCYSWWNYGSVITLVKEVIYKSLINKYRLFGDRNKNGGLCTIQKIELHLFKPVFHFEIDNVAYNEQYLKFLENKETFMDVSFEIKYCTTP